MNKTMPKLDGRTSAKFLGFLESLKDSNASNHALLEAIASGFSVLLENPDHVDIPAEDLYLEFNDEDAIPFFYLNAKDAFYIDTSLKGQMHLKMVIKLTEEEKVKNPEKWKGVSDWKISRDLGFLSDDGKKVLGTNGRIWLNTHIISFWDYPAVSDFKKILEKISGAGIHIDSTWRVEVYTDDQSTSELVPIAKYSGKYILTADKKVELDKMREIHTMSPIDKEKLKKARLASGAPLTAPDGKTPSDLNGRTMAEYNYEKNASRGD